MAYRSKKIRDKIFQLNRNKYDYFISNLTRQNFKRKKTTLNEFQTNEKKNKLNIMTKRQIVVREIFEFWQRMKIFQSEDLKFEGRRPLSSGQYH